MRIDGPDRVKNPWFYRDFISKKRNAYATIFLHHFSGFTYVHLQSSTNMEETLKTKTAFESYVRSLGVRIRYYHTDNDKFTDKEFKQAIQDAGQSISYCGDNAHFQNGRAEKKIMDLQDKERTTLLHTIARWPQTITTHLWLYALAHVYNVDKRIPNDKTGCSPLELFSSTEVKPRPKTFHTFGCPNFTLNSRLQNDQSVPK